jgi:hypothetical protein
VIAKPDPNAAGLDVATGVEIARQIVVTPELLDVVGNGVEVFDVHLEFLEGLETSLRGAQIPFLLVLLLSLSGQAVLP